MSARTRLLNIYWTLRRAIAPTLRYSQYSYEEALKRYVTPSVEWVEIGCGHAILPNWRSNEERQLVKTCKIIFGIDHDLPSLKAHRNITKKLRGDVTKLPFKSEAFDLVTANMVVEHLDDPAEQFREIGRILKPKGVFLFHTPNAYGHGVILSKFVPEWLKGKLIYLLEGRDEQDIFPTHYKANTEAQVKMLAHANGFEVVQLDLIATDAIFAMIPPLAALELLWIRLLMTQPFRSLRTNMIVALRKIS
jgi:SAM-dependent methyltransferase